MKIRPMLVLTTFLFTACKMDSYLADAKIQGSLSKEEIESLFREKGVKETTLYGYKQYHILYTTQDIDGSEVNASGIITIPLTTKKEYDIILNCHPTLFLKKRAPSTRGLKTVNPSMLFSAQGGFITIEPDFIGFGASKEREHLYFLKEQSTQATVDFFKAALEFLELNGISYRKFYLSGYSEGAFIALATLKQLEEEGFSVEMTIPIGGVYMLEPLAASILRFQTITKPSIITAVVKSYTLASGYELETTINPTLIKKIDRLYSGNYSIDSINRALPKQISGDGGLFQRSFTKNYQGSWFQEMLRSNSTTNFFPNSQLRFLHCIGDDAIPYQSASMTSKFFQKYRFADSKIIPVENFITQNRRTDLRINHRDCAFAAYKVANFLFRSESQKREP